MSNVIEVSGLSKTFRVQRARHGSLGARVKDLIAPRMEAVSAVDQVSFSITRGERVAFIGPNGAGKSTTLKMLSGILYPDAGHATVLGYVPWRQRQQLGYHLGTVFGQRSQLFYHLPARDTFALLAAVYEVDAAVHRQRLAALVERFELGALLDKPVSQLSLGERMRAEIAASLLHQPQLLFLDEPTIGLDASAKAQVRALLREQSGQDAATLLLTSHDTGDIESVCQRAIVIHSGRIVWDGALSELRRRYLKTKRVTLLSDCETLDIGLPGVRVVASGSYQTELVVDLERTAIATVIDAVLRRAVLRDLAIEDQPLDAVISALYRDTAGQESRS
jgi:ABC-2 type transport system ATP-binding protein